MIPSEWQKMKKMDDAVTHFLNKFWAKNPDKFHISITVEFRGFKLESSIDEM